MRHFADGFQQQQALFWSSREDAPGLGLLHQILVIFRGLETEQ